MLSMGGPSGRGSGGRLIWAARRAVVTGETNVTVSGARLARRSGAGPFRALFGHALAFADSVVLLQHGQVMYDGAAADLGDVVERFPPTSPS